MDALIVRFLLLQRRCNTAAMHDVSTDLDAMQRESLRHGG